MATLVEYLTYDSSTASNHKSWAQGFGNAFSTLGWVSSNDAGTIQSGSNYGTATITNISITSNVLTVTFSGATNQFASGMTVQLTGLTTNTFLNNQYVTIQNSGTPANDHTNTTFLAAYIHGNVSSSDTGTVTILYNWSTSGNTTDTISATFPLNHTFRFRGAWVGLTPSFTNLQTTNNQTTISFGTNGHGLDLTRTVGQGLTIGTAATGGTNITNGSFTWLNTNPTGGWPILSLTSTTIVINTGSSPRSDIASTAVTVGTSAPNYTGASTNGSICDTAIYSGDLYIMIASNITNVQPGTNTTDWKRFFFDIWTSNDTLSSTNKLYVKILYGATATFQPVIYLYFGTATDGVGNITQNYNWGATTPLNIANAVGTITGTALWESDFSGTSGRFAAILWRGYSAGTAPTVIFSIERSHDNSGNDTDAYWTFLTSGTGQQLSQSIFKPGTGGAGILESSANGQAIHTIQTAIGQSYNNSIPVLPVFPLVGYVANPLLGVISMKSPDTGEGALVSTTFYGTTHPYLMTIRGGAAEFGNGTNNAAGIRWE